MINRTNCVSINCVFMHCMNPTLSFPVTVSVRMLLVIKKPLHTIVI